MGCRGLLQGEADLLPVPLFVTLPGGCKRLLNGLGDARDDLRVGHPCNRRRARPPLADYAHGVTVSPGSAVPDTAASGYQSCSGASPAARKPSRARSVMSLLSRNSKRGSRT